MTYVLDIVLTPTEATRVFVGNQIHACAPQFTPNFYKYAIRRSGEPGWVFRFASIHGVAETLAALNEVAVGVAA